MNQPAAGRNGRIITFYSYKGGTGRSMTLANVAWILASQGHSVLVVDWDVEAPGVHRYFHPFLADPQLSSTEGIIDIVWDYAVAAVEHASVPDQSWRRRYTDVLRYVTSLTMEFPSRGGIDFLCAGRQNLTYSTRVSTFDWRGFYDRLGGGEFLEALRAEMRREYDYILIDSRTGVSDTAGICTVHLPDALVVCFTLNNQSIEGASGVAQSVLKQRGQEFAIFPVPTRVELAEKDKLERGMNRARSRFAAFPNSITSASAREEYWRAVQMLYWPYYAYEEVLATLADRPDMPARSDEDTVAETTQRSGNTLLASCERLTAYVTSNRVKNLAPLAESRRTELLARYSATEPALPDSLAQTAESIFTATSPENQKQVAAVFTRLVHVARAGHGEDTAFAVPVAELQQRMSAVQPFLDAGVLRTEFDSKSGVQVLTLADARLITNWGRFAQWIEQDRAFLLWVQLVQAGRAAWIEKGRLNAGLFVGAPLAETGHWLRTRPDALTPSELEYLRASRRAKRSERTISAMAVAVVVGFMGWGVIRGVLENRAESRREDAREVLAEARRFVAANQVDSALAAFDDALHLDPALSEAWVERANFRMAIADTTEVVHDYSRGIELDSSRAAAWLGRARALALRGDFDRAISDYSRALAIDSLNVDGYFDRGAAYQLAGHRPRAIADFQTVIDLSTDARTIEAARVRLDSLGVRTTPIVEARPVIFVHVASEEDRKITDAVAGSIRRMGYDVAGVEVKRTANSRGDVRSFFESDRRAADDIGAAFEKEFTSYGYRLSLQRLALDSARFQSARRGQIEVWLPPLMAPPRGLRQERSR